MRILAYHTDEVWSTSMNLDADANVQASLIKGWSPMRKDVCEAGSR
jgi:hypothetical protein